MSNSYPKNAHEMLAAMARMYNYDLTSFESMLWVGEIFDIYNDKDVIFALKYHMENGTRSRFMPKYGEIKQLLEVHDDTLQEIRLLVSRYGSYSPPPVNETTPLVLATIEQLGGWVKVCAEMPDASDSASFSQYIKRAESACQAARKHVGVYKKAPKGLIGRNVANLLKNDINQMEGKQLGCSVAFSAGEDNIKTPLGLNHLKSALFANYVNKSI